MIKPLARMRERYELERSDSDVAAFYALLFTGELVTKLVVSVLLAGLKDDRDKHRYAQLRGLVRADGIGDWASALDGILTGPASQFLRDNFRDLQRELTQRHPQGVWQYQAVSDIRECLCLLDVEPERLGQNVAMRQWFQWFALLRNKTRGHGATLSAECATAAPLLERSLIVIMDNLSVFGWEWAYLHRNLSGKYRVTPLSDRATSFDPLKSQPHHSLSDGVYVYLGEPLIVELLHSDPDATDFFLPNGQFRGAEYELLSYITNERRRIDGSEYLAPTGHLPASETQGNPRLDTQGQLFGNLPIGPKDYVPRHALEERLSEVVLKDRHEVISLTGPGGIGKTSLALTVLHALATDSRGRFDAIIWFSARDIDLLPSGPKPVRPHGLSLEDFAAEFVRLVEPAERVHKGFKATDYFAAALTKAPLGPTLFVFDNFETVVGPAELFRWLDAHIRAPNKVLVTTRTRDFVGDLPIEVPGMTEDEANQLIDSVAARLGIADIVTSTYRQALFSESGGHPYVVKILLGELSKDRSTTKPSRIIATQDRILQALFERTYSALSPASQRVFLLLCTWRSLVPALAVEAVVMRRAEERIDVRSAIDELRRLSLVEEFVGDDHESFLSVPLAATSFGRRKLNASPFKVVVEADSELLQAFGAVRRGDVRSGVRHRITRLMKALASRLASNKEELAELRPMLEFIASRVPRAWLDVAQLYLEEGGAEGQEWAKNALRRYLESGDHELPRHEVWARLAQLCRVSRDPSGEVHALVEMADDESVSTEELSRAAITINSLLALARRDGKQLFAPEERRLLLGRLTARMEPRTAEMDATDLSRLAWLHLQLNNEARASALVSRGLELEPANEHCRSLAAKGIRVTAT